MTKQFRRYEPNQTYLLPQNPADWLPTGHLVFYVRDIVESLDLSPFFSRYEQESRGAPPYSPLLLCRILVYGYAVGVRSSRRLERACEEDVAFRVLVANNFPDHTTISEFRRENLAHFEHLFREVLRLCTREGMLKLGVVAIDGTKMKANASREKTVTGEQVDRLIEQEVRHILEEAERIDQEEDAQYGPENRGNQLPPHLQSRKGRLERLKETKRQMDEEDARRTKDYENKVARRKEFEETTGKKSTGPAPKRPEERTRQPAKKGNTTDPDSRAMMTQYGAIQGYNAQAAADHESGLIVAAYVTQHGNDKQELGRHLREIHENTLIKPEIVLGDPGFWSHDEITGAPADIEILIRSKAWENTANQGKGSAPDKKLLRERMEARLARPREKCLYALRKQIIEPVFGTIKETLGFRGFLLRGKEKTDAEFKLLATSYDIKKMWRRGLSVT